MDQVNSQWLASLMPVTPTACGLSKLLLDVSVDEGKPREYREWSSSYFFWRREAVRCGSLIRLKHTNTKAYLHSHLHPSPLSKQQEVSCYDGQDSGDDWQVQCTKGDWLREQPVQLIHKDTSAYLTGSEQYQFGQPIPGQLEIAAYKSTSKHAYWVAQVSGYGHVVEN